MIHAELNQSRLAGGQRLPARTLDAVLREVSRGLRSRKDTNVSIALVSASEMRRLNKEWRGKDALTDVLSFGDEHGNGEILISYEQARIQAKQLGHSTRDELAFLIVHGLLHLHGYDHERPADAKKMFPLQTRILTVLGIDPRL